MISLCAEDLPSYGGTYILILRSRLSRVVLIGALGYLTMRKGLYVYVGSAFGSGGIRTRLSHHIRISQRPHWHIDYLRPHTQLQEMLFTSSPVRLEHAWSHSFSKARGVELPLVGFGSSDCQCSTHLFFFESFSSCQTLLHHLSQIVFRVKTSPPLSI